MRVIVVGGGFAGVSAAIALTDAGHTVELHEVPSSLGGRAHHFPPPPGFPVPLDNAPHLFSGAYHATFALLERLGRENLFHRVDPLEIDWLLPGGSSVSLKAAPLPGPFHLLGGLLASDAFSLRAKMDLARHLLSFRDLTPGGHTVAQYLDETHADRETRKRFWEPLTRAVVNMPPEEAPLEGLTSTVPRMFLGPRHDTAFVIPRLPLSDLFGDSVSRALEQKGGRVHLKSTVESLHAHDGRVQTAQTTQGERLHADAWVLAVPPHRLTSLLPEEPWANLQGSLGTSPIVAAHFYLERPILEGHFACLDGAKFEWVFNRNRNWDLPLPGQVLSLISSSDRDLASQDLDALSDLAWRELFERLPEASGVRVLAKRANKELSATFAWTLANSAHRPTPRTPLANLFLAGDWTDTGLPATIEGAVLSGRKAADLLLDPAGR